MFAKAPAHASTNTVHLDIHVSINASKSLSMPTTSYNFGVLSVNTSSVSATSIAVTNDSAALQETNTIQGANATGGNGWTLNTTTGTIDNYVFGVKFSSSTPAPANVDSAWTTSLTSLSVVACSDTQFGDGVHGNAGDQVSPVTATTRNLWLRMITPLYVTDTTQKNITITLAVQ